MVKALQERCTKHTKDSGCSEEGFWKLNGPLWHGQTKRVWNFTFSKVALSSTVFLTMVATLLHNHMVAKLLGQWNHHLIAMKWQSSLVHGWLAEVNYTWVSATLWEFVTSFSGQSYNNSAPGLILHSIGLQTVIHQWAMVNPAHIQDTMRGHVYCDVVSKVLIGNPRPASAQWGKRHCSLEMCWYMPPNFHSPDN